MPFVVPRWLGHHVEVSGLVWFRRDLRLDDNPAWSAATRDHDRVQAVFVVDPSLWSGGPKRRLDLLASHLVALDARLAGMGGRLRIVQGDPRAVLPELARDATDIYWNDDWTPYSQTRDAAVASSVDCGVHRYPGLAIQPPGALLTGEGQPYKVFTPFWRRWREAAWSLPPEPGAAEILADPGEGLPTCDPLHPGGEEPAVERLLEFLERVDCYDEDRDRPDRIGTSLLSADLKFGTIAPHRIRVTVGEHTSGRESFVRQLCWREFWLQVMDANPTTPNVPMKPEYDAVEWREDPEGFAAWKEGRTGYPIVDAAMRQLAAEGWIHNRLRMIVASFLVKDLLVDWRLGERWFRHCLLDWDLSQNVGNWQWVAGTGADAAPYFRVMNPTTQGRRFDPEGTYVRSMLPELSGLHGAQVHEPWELGPLELAAAGVTLGQTYPEPIVDHGFARERVIAAFDQAKVSRP